MSNQLNEEYDEMAAKGLNLDDYISGEVQKGLEEQPPITLKDLERVLTQATSLGAYWEANPQFPSAWNFRLDSEQMPCTFDRAVFDRYPETLRLITYGEPTLENLLKMVRPLPHLEKANFPLIRFEINEPEHVIAYFGFSENEATPIETLQDLERYLKNPPPGKGPGRKVVQNARRQFDMLFKEREKDAFEKMRMYREASIRALEEQGRRLLIKTALGDISLAQEPSLFDQASVEADFDEETIQRLRKRNYPFAPLFKLIDTEGLKPEPTDPFWPKVQGRSEREIRGIQDYLRREVKKLVENLSKAKGSALSDMKSGPITVQHFFRQRPELVLIISPPKEQWFKRYLPVYSLKAAAGYFGEGEAVEPEGWVKVDGFGTLDEAMFVARAVGQSMEPRIQDGDYLVFRANPSGSRIGKIVLAQYRGPEDPDTGGKYTVKKYSSEKVSDEEGGWRHTRITLAPLNPDFSPIIFREDSEDAVKVIAEYLGTLQAHEVEE